MLESIAAGSNTGAALVAMSRWAAHRRRLPSPGGAGAKGAAGPGLGPGAGPWARAGAGGGEAVSPLFDSEALPAVFERLLLLATTTAATTRIGDGGPLCPGGGGDNHQQQHRRRQGERRGWAAAETVGGSRGGVGDGDGGDGDDLLEEAKSGLDDLLRWALPSLVGGVPSATWWFSGCRVSCDLHRVVQPLCWSRLFVSALTRPCALRGEVHPHAGYERRPSIVRPSCEKS